jgi:hypothetical protein
MSADPFIAGAFTVIVLGLQQWQMHRQNLKNGEARDQKLDFILTEHSPHSHDETGPNEPLTTRGLSYPKTKWNGSSR